MSDIQHVLWREYVYILNTHMGGADGTKRWSPRTALYFWKQGISIATVSSGMYKGGREGEKKDRET